MQNTQIGNLSELEAKRSTFFKKEMYITYANEAIEIISLIIDKEQCKAETQQYALFLTPDNKLIGWKHINTGKAPDIKRICTYAVISGASNIVLVECSAFGYKKLTNRMQMNAEEVSTSIALLDLSLIDVIYIDTDFNFYSFDGEDLHHTGIAGYE